MAFKITINLSCQLTTPQAKYALDKELEALKAMLSKGFLYDLAIHYRGTTYEYLANHVKLSTENWKQLADFKVSELVRFNKGPSERVTETIDFADDAQEPTEALQTLLERVFDVMVAKMRENIIIDYRLSHAGIIYKLDPFKFDAKKILTKVEQKKVQQKATEHLSYPGQKKKGNTWSEITL